MLSRRRLTPLSLRAISPVKGSALHFSCGVIVGADDPGSPFSLTKNLLLNRML